MVHPHPLLFPNVLNKMFSYFTPKELRLLRLVNLDWNHSACIVISHNEAADFHSPNDLQQYQSIFMDSSFCPHNTYNFHYKMTEEDFQYTLEFVKNFWHSIRNISVTIGSGFLNTYMVHKLLQSLPNIETLELHFHYFSCPELEPENSRFEISTLPNLKVINVDVQSYDAACSANFLCSILEAAPNLKKIRMPRFFLPPTKCRIPSLMNIFLTEIILEESLDSNCLTKLQFLDFIMKLNEENIRVLVSKNYPLKHLFINLWYPDNEAPCVTTSSLKLLMSQLAPCLEKLGLDFPWGKEVASEFIFQLPMKKLEYISLTGYQGCLPRLLDKMPVVCNIELSQVDFFEILPPSQITRNYPTVAKLRLDFCTNQLPGGISKLSRIFPNLRSLDMNHATDEICRMLFQRMFSLEFLRLHGDDFTDEGITGISLEKIKENDLINATIEKGNSLRQYAFIGNLPNLRQLKLEAYKLTEVCIRHGLIHCTSLQFVSLDTRLEKNDPLMVTTRTFRLSEYGKNLLEGEKEGTLVLQEEIKCEEDEDAEKFFKMYEKGMVTDLLFA